MINFFRKIRKKLADDNKPLKYFRYAIGEIVLVVIGILIALSINNWNEDRKKHRLEQTYYCKLLEDLGQDIIQITEQIENNELRIKNSNQLIGLLQQTHISQKEVIKHTLGAVSKTTFTFTPSMAAFEDLKSSGNLGLLKDVELKNKLITYYTSLEGYKDVLDINSDKVIEAFYDKQKDFRQIGWQHFSFVATEIDTCIVDLEALQVVDYPSEKLRTLLMSDALMYLGSSSRKKDLYLVIAEKINTMYGILSQKCNLQNN